MLTRQPNKELCALINFGLVPRLSAAYASQKLATMVTLTNTNELWRH